MFATLLALALLAPPPTVAAEDPVVVTRQADATAPQAPGADATSAPASEGAPDQLEGRRLSINDAAFLRAHHGQRVGLADERGEVAMGRVVRTESGTVIVRLDGRDVAVAARNVDRIEMEGDPPTDGAVKGFIVGATLVGMALVNSAISGSHVDAAPMLSMLVTTTTIGFIVDFLTPGHETVLVAPRPGGAPVHPASAGVSNSGRRLMVGYRIRF